MYILHFQLITSCLWPLSYYKFFRTVYGPEHFAGRFCFPPLISEVFCRLSHLQDKMSNFSLQRWKSWPVFCLLWLMSWALSTFLGWSERNSVPEKKWKHILDRYKLIVIFNNHIWWWCQTYTWCSHAAFTHKCRIHLLQGSVLVKLSGEEQRTGAAAITGHSSTLTLCTTGMDWGTHTEWTSGTISCCKSSWDAMLL